MKRIEKDIIQYLELDKEEKSSLSYPLATVDGYIVEEHRNRFESRSGELVLIQESISYSHSYDNDFDNLVPSILLGVKNPNSEERRNQSPKRKYRFPRSLLKYRDKNIQFWESRQTNLAEMMSAYPQLSFGTKIGKRKANELLSLFIYIYWKKRPQEVSFLEDILDSMERRCRANNYQGDWSLLSKVLQLRSSKIALLGFIRENFHKRMLYGNLLPKGEKIYKELTVVISLYPVNAPQRKRGYSDKGSTKFAHETHDLSISSSTVEMTRSNLTLSPDEALLHHLYGVTNPCRKGIEPASERLYRKKMNQQHNQKRRAEIKRMKSLSSPVKIIKTSED